MHLPIQIFISYRRTDSGGHARLLYDRLKKSFRSELLFFDQNNIDSGESFPEEIAKALLQAKVLLVVIGRDWVTTLNERLGQSDQVDYVREEVKRGMERQRQGSLHVVPVLVGDGSLDFNKLEVVLQQEFKSLPDLNRHTLSAHVGYRYDSDIEELVRVITAALSQPTPTAASSNPSPNNLPLGRLSRFFHDPEGHVARLHQLFNEHQNSPLTVAVHGMGGVGKTQLVLQYAHSHNQTYLGGQWWFNAETSTALDSDARACCEALNLAVPHNHTAASVLRPYLEQQAQPWLLVLDNAETADAVKDYLPQRGGHRVVITSRNSRAWDEYATGLVDLQSWDQHQGAAFFAQRLGLEPSAELQQLSEKLGGLPLALAQAANYIRTSGSSVTAYLGLLAENMAAVLKEKVRGCSHPVLATLSLSLKHLSQATQELLRLLAYAAPSPVPEIWFSAAATEKDLLPPELACHASSAITWDQLRAELLRYGLAEAPNTSEPALQLHRLTQAALQQYLANASDASRWLRLLLHIRPSDIENPTQQSCYDFWIDHADHFAGVEKQVLAIDQGNLDTPSLDTLRLMNDITLLQKHALILREKNLGTEHPNTLTSISNLASTLPPTAKALQGINLSNTQRHEKLRAIRSITEALQSPSLKALQRHMSSLNISLLRIQTPESLRAVRSITDAFQSPSLKALLELNKKPFVNQNPDMLKNLDSLAKLSAPWEKVRSDMEKLSPVKALQALVPSPFEKT